MRLDVKLPAEYERKWKRLLSVYGPDARELAVAAVDSLWEEFHEDVEASERSIRSQAQRIRAVERKLAKIKSGGSGKVGPSVFVGSYRSKVSARGAVIIPTDWLPYFADGRVAVVPCADDGEVRILPPSSDAFGKAGLPTDAYVARIGSGGQVVLSAKVRKLANIGTEAILVGAVNSARIMAVEEAGA